MSQRIRLVKFDMDCEAAIAQIRRCLVEHGVRVVRSFDLQTACATFPDLTCPHHGDDPCDCQLVVLLVYGDDGTPASVVVHSHWGQTGIDLVVSHDQMPSPKLVSSIHIALVGQHPSADSVKELSDES